MNKQDVFAGAQMVTQHPILEERAEVKRQYYNYLKELVKVGKWGRRKYAKAQLEFYKNVLCGKSKCKAADKSYSAIRHYCYLFPFDIVAILAYHRKSIKPDVLAALIKKITSDFNLPDEAVQLLNREFSAGLGDDLIWNNILEESRLCRFTKYLSLVKGNISFIKEYPYNVLITATMSAGKSTFTNALIGKNISLMQNMVATSKIHVIISKPFDDGATAEYDARIFLDAKLSELLTDSNDNNTTRIIVSTYFNGLLGGQRLILFDSPGVNFSENLQHAEITKKSFEAKSIHFWSMYSMQPS